MSDDPYDMRANSVYKLREELAFALTERDALRAENARLLADIADWKIEAVTFGADTVPALRAENARLEQAITELTEENRLVGLQIDRLADENEKLCDEIHLLRTALKPFAVKAMAVEAQYENCLPADNLSAGIKYRDLRAARAAMGESDE